MWQVLEHYQEEGFVEVTPLYLPGHQPNSPILQHFYLYDHMANRDNTEKLVYSQK